MPFMNCLNYTTKAIHKTIIVAKCLEHMNIYNIRACGVYCANVDCRRTIL